MDLITLEQIIEESIQERICNGYTFEELNRENMRFNSDEVETEIGVPQEECQELNGSFTEQLESCEEVHVEYSMSKNDEGSDYTVSYTVELED